jgi:hypothetical protein
MGHCNSIMISPYTESQLELLSSLEKYSVIDDELVKVEDTPVSRRRRLKLRESHHRRQQSENSLFLRNSSKKIIVDDADKQNTTNLVLDDEYTSLDDINSKDVNFVLELNTNELQNNNESFPQKEIRLNNNSNPNGQLLYITTNSLRKRFQKNSRHDKHKQVHRRMLSNQLPLNLIDERISKDNDEVLSSKTINNLKDYSETINNLSDYSETKLNNKLSKKTYFRPKPRLLYTHSSVFDLSSLSSFSNKRTNPDTKLKTILKKTSDMDNHDDNSKIKMNNYLEYEKQTKEKQTKEKSEKYRSVRDKKKYNLRSWYRISFGLSEEQMENLYSISHDILEGRLQTFIKIFTIQLYKRCIDLSFKMFNKTELLIRDLLNLITKKAISIENKKQIKELSEKIKTISSNYKLTQDDLSLIFEVIVFTVRVLYPVFNKDWCGFYSFLYGCSE